jgi:AraC-like DNA-binding protein
MGDQMVALQSQTCAGAASANAALNPPLPTIRTLDTTDPELARQHVLSCHPWIRDYVPLEPGKSFLHHRSEIRLERVTLTRSTFSHVRIVSENRDKIVVVLAERGWRSVAGTGSPVISDSGASAVLVPRGRSIYVNGPNGTGYVVSVPRTEITGRFDLALDHDSRPHGLDLSSPAGSRYRATLQFLWQQLGSLAVACNPLVAAAYEDVLIHGLAALIRPAARERGHDKDRGPRLVNRACELIRSRSDEALRLSSIADELGVSLRHLQAGFRRHLGLTPQGFLQNCRIEKAYRLLSFPAPGDTVTTIALACGFGHLGEFAGQYRRHFGESPSDTLRLQRSKLN